MMTIDQQIESMEKDFPSWKVSRLSNQAAVWHGTLKPNKTEYLLRIEYTVPLPLENVSLAWIQPLVEVTSPELQELEGNKEGPLPHVYWNHPRTDRKGPFLCLFDPAGREWTISDPISKTTVPWASFWLDQYEGWLATGVWHGTGKHVPKRVSDNDDRRAKLRAELASSVARSAFFRNVDWSA